MCGLIPTLTAILIFSLDAGTGYGNEANQFESNAESNRGIDRYGDSLPEHALCRFGTTRFRSEMSNFSIAYSRDGRTLVSAGRSVCLWEAATGKLIRSISDSMGLVFCVRLSADGRTLATAGISNDGSGGNVIRIWNAATGKQIRELIGHRDNVYVIAFSPDGNTLASGSDDDTVRLWDVATGKQLLRSLEHQDDVLMVGFTPDGQTVVSAAKDETIRAWDLATGNEESKVAGPPGEKDHRMFQRSGETGSVAFSPDGKMVAWGCRDQTVRLLEVATGKERGRIKIPKSDYPCLVFAPDGKTIACGSLAETIVLWNASNGATTRVSTGQKTNALAFSLDGKHLAAAGQDYCVHLWETATQRPVFNFGGHTSRVSAMIFAQDGKTMTSGSDDGTVRIWSAATGNEIRRFETIAGIEESFAFSSDGKLFANARGPQIWEVATGIARHKLAVTDQRNTCIAFSPDGQWIALADEFVRIVNLKEANDERRIVARNGMASCVAFAPDGRTLAVGFVDRRRMDGRIVIHDLATGKELRDWAVGQSSSMTCAFASDGKALVVGTALVGKVDKGEVQLWEVSSGRQLRRFEHGTGCVTAVALDGNRRLAAFGRGKIVHLCEVSSGAELRQFTGHTGLVYCLVFSKDGKLLTSGSGDSSAIVWKLP